MEREVRLLLCRFLIVIMPLLVRNHASVKLMLRVQERIYETANRDEMIVLVLDQENLEGLASLIGLECRDQTLVERGQE